jgi:GTP pyrophosphokinase
MMKWLRQMVETQQDVDAREFVDTLKMELYPKEVYAVTPQGRVVQLPSQATPVDFAYAIHTKIGDQCTGAKVNGRIVPLHYQIQNGDQIEILTGPNQKPNRDWLKFVVTSRARNKIKHHVALRQREDSIEIGRKMFEKETNRLGLKLKKVLDDPVLAKYRADNGYPKPEDMFAAIGYGKLLAKSPLAKFISAEKLAELEKAETGPLQQVTKAVKRALNLGDDRIAIKGIDNVMVYRAPCCNPIRGEDVIGYITRGKGVGVHASRCKNVGNLMVNRERIIEVMWVGEGGNEPYAVKLAVKTEDRTGQLAALTNAVADIKTNIRAANTDNLDNNDGLRRIELTVDIIDMRHLERVRSALRRVAGVIEVERVAPQA